MTEADYRAVRVLKALAQPVRFQIVTQLRQNSMTPTQLCRAIKRDLPCVSQHLRVLRAADVVAFRTRANRIQYRLKDKLLLNVLDAIASYNRVIARRK